jgi:hypothetical protein
VLGVLVASFRRTQLVTLQDAADYIMKLPKADQDTAEWQAATEASIMAAENRDPLMRASVHHGIAVQPEHFRKSPLIPLTSASFTRS